MAAAWTRPIPRAIRPPDSTSVATPESGTVQISAKTAAASHSFLRTARSRKKTIAIASARNMPTADASASGPPRLAARAASSSKRRAGSAAPPRWPGARGSGFPGDGLEHAHQSAGKQYSPDQRIGETAREQARPCDQRIRPAPPDEGFESDVHQPAHAGEEQAEARPKRSRASSECRHVCRETPR